MASSQLNRLDSREPLMVESDTTGSQAESCELLGLWSYSVMKQANGQAAELDTSANSAAVGTRSGACSAIKARVSCLPRRLRRSIHTGLIGKIGRVSVSLLACDQIRGAEFQPAVILTESRFGGATPIISGTSNSHVRLIHLNL
jgi:hypothetical protein